MHAQKTKSWVYTSLFVMIVMYNTVIDLLPPAAGYQAQSQPYLDFSD